LVASFSQVFVVKPYRDKKNRCLCAFSCALQLKMLSPHAFEIIISRIHNCEIE
jgi:hypothetical protein